MVNQNNSTYKKQFNKLLKCKNNLFIKDLPFKIKIPQKFVMKMDFNNKKSKKNQCPIYNQFFPKKEELKKEKNFYNDPTFDKEFRKNNLLKKYKNRALLICSDKCQMHCRFCFRKNFPYEKIYDFSFTKELEIIKKDRSINEVILSGGDPLSLENNILKPLLLKLSNISHIRKIRFHTRYLTANPKRINSEFINILKSLKKQIIFVVHINHKMELDEEFFFYISKLQKIKIPILSQTVLLKNVNDQASILCELFETLSDNGIIPYYLHQLDKVLGSSHFYVSILKGKRIINELMTLTSGYNIPKYVREIPYKKSKTRII